MTWRFVNMTNSDCEYLSDVLKNKMHEYLWTNEKNLET